MGLTKLLFYPDAIWFRPKVPYGVSVLVKKRLYANTPKNYCLSGIGII